MMADINNTIDDGWFLVSDQPKNGTDAKYDSKHMSWDSLTTMAQDRMFIDNGIARLLQRYKTKSECNSELDSIREMLNSIESRFNTLKVTPPSGKLTGVVGQVVLIDKDTIDGFANPIDYVKD